jgi:FkbM family methyltransferase
MERDRPRIKSLSSLPVDRKMEWNFRNLAKELVILLFSACTAGKESIPILGGPLRGLRLPKTTALQNLHMLIGDYEPHVVSTIISSSFPLSVAFDIGANVGIMSLALARRIGKQGKVFAFEPLPASRRLIDKLVLVNLLQEMVCVQEAALADKDGEQNLVINECPSMSKLETLFAKDKRGTNEAIRVRTTTIDSFVFEQGNPAPDLIKMDVEGAECLVLQGALRTIETYAPRFVIEFHGPRKIEEAWPLMSNFHYSWYHIRREGLLGMFTEQACISLYSPTAWTQHFFLTRNDCAQEGTPGDLKGGARK